MDSSRIGEQRVSSWSAYDAQQQQRRRQRKDGGNVTGGSDRTPLSAAADDGSAGGGGGGPRRRQSSAHGGRDRSDAPTGIAALYHPAPAGIDTRLQFQWIRVHPATAFLAGSSRSSEASTSASAGDSSSAAAAAAFESARLVDRYQEVKSEGTGGDGGRKRPRQGEIGRSSIGNDVEVPSSQTCHLVKPSGVTVDLTSLMDPPLMSEWLPGSNTRISYESDDSDSSDGEGVRDGKTGNDGGAGSDGLDHAKINAVVDKLVEIAARESLAEKGNDDASNTAIDDEDVRLLEELSSEMLMEVLPSRTVLRKIESLQGSDGPTAGERDHYTTSIAFLRLLAESCPSEAIGRHTLSTLAPVLLTSAAQNSESNMTDADAGAADRPITESQRCGMNRLADALMSRCRLVNLSRVELLKLAEVDQHRHQEGLDSRVDLMEELGMSLGEAYFRCRRKG